MSRSSVDSEGGKSMDRRGSGKKVSKIDSDVHGRLTYGVKEGETRGGPYIEGGCCWYWS